MSKSTRLTLFVSSLVQIGSAALYYTARIPHEYTPTGDRIVDWIAMPFGAISLGLLVVFGILAYFEEPRA